MWVDCVKIFAFVRHNVERIPLVLRENCEKSVSEDYQALNSNQISSADFINEPINVVNVSLNVSLRDIHHMVKYQL